MEIIWTQNAQKKFINNLLYLEAEWFISVSKKFKSAVFQKLELLKTNSNTFQKAEFGETQKIYITKHITSYNLLEAKQIILLQTNSQNPENLSF